jgi:voltage-gated potassium channel
VDPRSERIAKRFEVPMLIASVLVIPTIIIEEAGSGEPLESLGVFLNYATWTAFLVEAVVMLWVVPDKWRWVREHPIEIIVVVLTPPFLFAALQPVRALRLLRLLRFLRLAPLVRRLFTRQGLRYTALLAFLTALAGAAAVHQAEKSESFWNGLYWAITTMTTVGYGDLAPETTDGKIVAVLVMLVGIGFVALLTGSIAEAFIRPRAAKAAEEAAAQRAEIEAKAHAQREEAERATLGALRELTARVAEIYPRHRVSRPTVIACTCDRQATDAASGAVGLAQPLAPGGGGPSRRHGVTAPRLTSTRFAGGLRPALTDCSCRGLCAVA